MCARLHASMLSERVMRLRGVTLSAVLCRVPPGRILVAKALAEASLAFSDRYQVVRP